MADLEDGEVQHVQGSAEKPYELKRSGDVYSCTCPAWLHQGAPVDQRTCKHLKQLRGEAAELARVGAGTMKSAPGEPTGKPAAVKKDTAPPILLAHSWENDRDLTGWWMSEKLDGMRAYWDGTRLVSRLGNQVLAPDWFVAGLPSEPVDGELWLARGEFQKTMSIVRSGGKGEAWREVRYLLFDAPGHGGTFEERIAWLADKFPAGAHEFAANHPQVLCAGLDHLKQELDRVEALGGEGLMMRQPGSRYVAGRSSTLLKVKRFFDAEAKVIGHQPGTRKHKGRMGALKVVLADGTEFAIGTGFTDKEREDPPPIGSVVTFRYQELSKDGVPRFGSYVGIREDAAWPPDPASQPKPGAKPAAPKASKPVPVPHTPAPPPVETSEPAGPMRRFELVEESAQRFWEIEVAGRQYRVRFGAIGTIGQIQQQVFANPAAAKAAAEGIIAEKLKKGFSEVAVAGPLAPPRGVESETEPEPETEAPSGGGARRFELVEGTSSKFWEVTQEGTGYRVRFGRIGSDGQTQIKDLGSEEAAQAAIEKLIAEKTKKGYEEAET